MSLLPQVPTLPDDVWLQIFSYICPKPIVLKRTYYNSKNANKHGVLSSLSQVNSKFCRLIPRVALQHVTFVVKTKREVTNLMKYLGQTHVGWSTSERPRIGYIQSLAIESDEPPMSDVDERLEMIELSQFAPLFQQATPLLHLVMSFRWLSLRASDISTLQCCINLTSLELKIHHPFGFGMNDRFFSPLAALQVLPNLKHLDYTAWWCSGGLYGEYRDEVGYGHMEQAIGRLESLAIRIPLAPAAQQYFGQIIVPTLTKLQRLKLRMHGREGFPEIYPVLARYCLALKDLDLAVEGDCFEQLFAEFDGGDRFRASIQTLTFLWHQLDLDTPMLIPAFQRLPNLKRLRIQCFLEETFDQIQRALPNVRVTRFPWRHIGLIN